MQHSGGTIQVKVCLTGHPCLGLCGGGIPRDARSVDLTHPKHRAHDPRHGTGQESVDVGINHVTARRLCEGH